MPPPRPQHAQHRHGVSGEPGSRAMMRAAKKRRRAVVGHVWPLNGSSVAGTTTGSPHRGQLSKISFTRSPPGLSAGTVWSPDRPPAHAAVGRRVPSTTLRSTHRHTRARRARSPSRRGAERRSSDPHREEMLCPREALAHGLVLLFRQPPGPVREHFGDRENHGDVAELLERAFFVEWIAPRAKRQCGRGQQLRDRLGGGLVFRPFGRRGTRAVLRTGQPTTRVPFAATGQHIREALRGIRHGAAPASRAATHWPSRGSRRPPHSCHSIDPNHGTTRRRIAHRAASGGWASHTQRTDQPQQEGKSA